MRVKDYISQSGIFVLCAFAMLGLAAERWRSRRMQRGLLFVAVAAAMIANVVYVVTGRTALVVAVLTLLFALRLFGWKGAVSSVTIGCVVAVLAWASSPYLRERVSLTYEELTAYQANEGTIV